MIQDPAMQGRFKSKLQELYVNATTGRDDADGTPEAPFKTITYALRQALAEIIIIRVGSGTYSAETGEHFPLVVPAQASILGDDPIADNIVIRGGGDYHSPTFGNQTITLLLEENAILRGITITNPAAKGTGVWIESVPAAIAHCKIVNCGREGIFVTGHANPSIADCTMTGNRASGTTFVRHAKGDVRRSLYQGNGFGIVMSDYAAPLIAETQVLENRSGIILSGIARPVIRKTVIQRNQEDGVAVFSHALPDLGNSQDPAGNRFEHNSRYDLHNATPTPLIVAGSVLNPNRVLGQIDLVASLVPSSPNVQPHSSQSQSSQSKSSQSQSSQSQNKPSILQAANLRSANPKLLPVWPPVGSPSSLAEFSSSPPLDLVGHWAEPFIRHLLAEDNFNNLPDEDLTASFRPDDVLSGAEFAVWVAKLFHPLNQAKQTRGANACSNLTVQPDAPLTRLQAIAALVNQLNLDDGDPTLVGMYRDRSQIPSVAIGAVAAATQHRLIVLPKAIGHQATYRFNTHRLNPLEPVTRAEGAAMLYQGLVHLHHAKPIASPHLVNLTVFAASFADMSCHWAADFIQGVVSQGWMDGSPEGLFDPDRPMTRAEFAALLARVFYSTPERPVKAFSDVPDSFWAKAAIEQVYQGKLMGGFADGTFRPDQDITRVQVLLALVNALKCPAADLDVLNRYGDAITIPTATRPAIAAATAQWLVVNYPKLTRLRPNEPATRAEVAAILYQALVRVGRAVPLSSAYIIDPRYPNQHRDFRALPVVVLDPGHGGSEVGVFARRRSPEQVKMPPGMSPLPSGGMPPGFSPGMPPGFPPPHQPFPTASGMPRPNRGMPPGMPPMPPDDFMGEGLREKDVVLAIAQQTATYLEQHGIKVVFTRSVDRQISLAERAAIANQAEADVLVSIHANGATFPPSQKPNPEQARQNRDISGVETYHHPNSTEGAALAHAIHTNIVQSLDVADRGVRATNFYLLRSVLMPATHVEVGYLTNKEDAINLTNAEYCHRMAEAIAKGILHYVQELA